MPRPALLRWLVPALLVLVWLGVGAVAGPMSAKIADVQENGNSTFLPANAERITFANTWAEARRSLADSAGLAGLASW